jgi:transposase
MMSPQFVKPYRKSDKNDRNDAEAICEAVTRPNMRFVAVKSATLETSVAVAA